MKIHIALLRGINVGGNKKVAMADLRSFVEAIGFKDARTLLNSGNLVFSSDGREDDRTLETRLETEAAKHLGLQTWFLVRSVREWSEVIARNPFSEEAKMIPSRFLVMFFRQTPGSEAVQSLSALAVDTERFHFDGMQLYAVYPDGVLESKMANVLIGARFSKLATGRNWNTVLKLAALTGLGIHTV